MAIAAEDFSSANSLSDKESKSTRKEKKLYPESSKMIFIDKEWLLVTRILNKYVQERPGCFDSIFRICK